MTSTKNTQSNSRDNTPAKMEGRITRSKSKANPPMARDAPSKVVEGRVTKRKINNKSSNSKENTSSKVPASKTTKLKVNKTSMTQEIGSSLPAPSDAASAQCIGSPQPTGDDFSTPSSARISPILGESYETVVDRVLMPPPGRNSSALSNRSNRLGVSESLAPPSNGAASASPKRPSPTKNNDSPSKDKDIYWIPIEDEERMAARFGRIEERTPSPRPITTSSRARKSNNTRCEEPATPVADAPILSAAELAAIREKDLVHIETLYHRSNLLRHTLASFREQKQRAIVERKFFLANMRDKAYMEKLTRREQEKLWNRGWAVKHCIKMLETVIELVHLEFDTLRASMEVALNAVYSASEVASLMEEWCGFGR